MFKKKILPIVIFILLLCGMAYFPYIPIGIFRINYEEFNQSMKVLYTFCCDIGFMLIIFCLFKKQIITDFKKYFKNFLENFENSFKYYFIGLIIMVISNLVIGFLFKQANANNEEAVRLLIDSYPLYMIFSVSIYAPFVEEMIFRKTIKDIVLTFGNKKWLKYLYIIISGLIFASLHVVGITSSIWDYLYIIPYLALGCAFSSLYYKTDNIFSTITMHCLHNTVAIILYLI